MLIVTASESHSSILFSLNKLLFFPLVGSCAHRYRRALIIQESFFKQRAKEVRIDEKAQKYANLYVLCVYVCVCFFSVFICALSAGIWLDTCRWYVLRRNQTHCDDQTLLDLRRHIIKCDLIWLMFSVQICCAIWVLVIYSVSPPWRMFTFCHHGKCFSNTLASLWSLSPKIWRYITHTMPCNLLFS